MLPLAISLLVLAGCGAQHVADPAPAQPAARWTDDAIGQLWLLEAFVSADSSRAAVLTGSEPRLTFGADGSLSGSGGCNTFHGSWRVDPPGDAGGVLHIGPLAATKMACASPPGLMLQEQRLLAALEQAHGVQRSNEYLRIDHGTKGAYLWLTDRVREQVPPPDSVRVDSSSTDIRAIRGGTSFGECLGYCWQEVELLPATAQLTRRGWDVRAWPETSVARPFDGWQGLLELADLQALYDLEEVLGCPDCADGGAEWIELETASGNRRVTFEYGAAPAALRELAQVLETLRRELLRDMEVATVIR